MPLLPYQSLVIHSPLPPADVASRLAGHVEPRRTLRLDAWNRFRSGLPPRAFEGEVGDGGFAIRPILSYGNASRPEIEGRIEPAARGSRVRVTMRLAGPVAAFTAVWICVAALFCLVAALAEVLGARGMLWIPLLMLVLSWTVVSGAFTWEARNAEYQLAGLFEASSVERGG